MSDSPPPSAPVSRAKLRSLILHHLSFTREGDWRERVSEDVGIQTTFSLRATRLKNHRLGVEFGLRMGEEGLIDLEIEYRLVFELTQSPEDDAERDSDYRSIAARLAPTIALPYIRETIQSVTGKASSTPIVLPVLNIGAAFSPESVELEVEDEE